jgi:RNA-directed DNA polymerase
MKQPSLLGIAKKAASDKAHRFQNLSVMLTVGFLLACWRLINKRAAYGVDRMDARTYEKNLQENIEALVAAVSPFKVSFYFLSNRAVDTCGCLES